MPGIVGLFLLATAAPYQWTSVPAGGGGFVEGSGYRAEALTKRPPLKETTGKGGGDFYPQTSILVGRAAEDKTSNLYYTTDGGRRWNGSGSMPPGAADGRIVASADASIWVWSLADADYRSDDLGGTWTVCEGLPSRLPILSDRTGVGRFYAADRTTGQIYLSDDGAKNFEERPYGSPDRPLTGQGIYSAVGRAGDLWATASDGLFHAKPGAAFVRVEGVSAAEALGFGMPPQGKRDATMFLAGTVGGVKGLFRSDDAAVTWVRIDQEAPQASSVSRIEGDLRHFGRVYAQSEDGRTIVGEPR